MITRTRRITPSIVFAFLATAVIVPPASGVRAVEDGIEVAQLHISPGPPPRVRAVGCPSCPRTFRLSDNYELIVDGQQMARERWPEQQGKVGTLIYNIESGQAVRLRW